MVNHLLVSFIFNSHFYISKWVCKQFIKHLSPSLYYETAKTLFFIVTLITVVLILVFKGWSMIGVWFSEMVVTWAIHQRNLEVP